MANLFLWQFLCMHFLFKMLFVYYIGTRQVGQDMYGFNSPTQMKYPSPNAPSSMSMPQSASGRGSMSHLRRSPNPGNNWQTPSGFSQNQVLGLFCRKIWRPIVGFVCSCIEYLEIYHIIEYCHICVFDFTISMIVLIRKKK